MAGYAFIAAMVVVWALLGAFVLWIVVPHVRAFHALPPDDERNGWDEGL
jgi:hypothetical protein